MALNLVLCGIRIKGKIDARVVIIDGKILPERLLGCASIGAPVRATILKLIRLALLFIFIVLDPLTGLRHNILSCVFITLHLLLDMLGAMACRVSLRGRSHFLQSFILLTINLQQRRLYANLLLLQLLGTIHHVIARPPTFIPRRSILNLTIQFLRHLVLHPTQNMRQPTVFRQRFYRSGLNLYMVSMIVRGARGHIRNHRFPPYVLHFEIDPVLLLVYLVQLQLQVLGEIQFVLVVLGQFLFLAGRPALVGAGVG